MISIIYVYYNSYTVIQESIKSLLKNDFKNYEIIIVVNKCEDNKVEKLSLLSDKIKVIYNENENKGFGFANNLGAKNARGEYLLILNPDTILENNVLSEMYGLMEKEKNIGASICKLIDENNNIQKTVMRLKYNLLSILINHFFLHKIPIINRLYKKHYYYEPYYTKIQFPQTISGAFMFIRKKIYDNIGGFDEKYFMYSEDNDLSIRINKISKIIYYPKVTTIHIGATTFGKAKSIENLKIFYKSLFYFIEKFYGKKKLFLMKIAFKINAIVLFPFVYAISNQNLKITLINRNKLFLKMPLRGTDV